MAVGKLSMLPEGTKAGQPKRLLRVEEAAEYLNIKPSTVRAWLLKRKLPSVHVGQRAVRIPSEALERLIVENTIPAQESQK